MKLIVCVDDKNGMMFNKRRQSKDRYVVDKINSLIIQSELYIHEYSKTLFPYATIVSDFSEIDGYCFIENPDFIPKENIDGILLFKWNRHYPSDKKFEIDLTTFDMIESVEFEGYSHENITLEFYKKKG